MVTENDNELKFKHKTVMLIDSFSLIFRSYYAMPDLTNNLGYPTGASYGFFNMINSIIMRYKPDYCVCVFDTPGGNFRHDIYKEYKANRKSTPEELKVQIKDIVDLIDAIGLPLIKLSGFEADDVIGTISNFVVDHHEDHQVIILSNDKDFSQLVRPNNSIVLLQSHKYFQEIIVDYQGVIDKFGVRPEQIIDYLSLIGDAVDNIKGVEKCGPKTAVGWLKNYDNIDNLINNINNISGRIKDNLIDSIKWLPIAKELITIRCDLDLDKILIPECSLNTLEYRLIDHNKLINKCKDLGFEKLIYKYCIHNLDRLI